MKIDPRGQGNSSKSTGGNTLKCHAQDIKELIEHLNLEDVVLLGWSLAASVLVTYAKEFNQYRLSGPAQTFIELTRQTYH